MIFNDYLDAGVAAFFLACVLLVLIASLHEWYAVLLRGKRTASTETPWTVPASDSPTMSGAA